MTDTAQPLRSFSDEVDAAREFWAAYFDEIPVPLANGSDEPTEEFTQFLQGTHPEYPQATVASRGKDVEAFLKSCMHERDFAAFTEWNADALNGDSLNLESPTFKEYLCGSVYAPADAFKKCINAEFKDERITENTETIKAAFSAGAVKNAARLTRTVPESLSVKLPPDRGIEHIRILWLLKNPGYGGNDVIRLAQDGTEGVPNTAKGGEAFTPFIRDQGNVAALFSDDADNARLPWDIADTKGWYFDRARFYLLDECDKKEPVSWNEVIPERPQSGERARDIVRMEMFPYRTKAAGDIPKVIDSKNKKGQLLPSQELVFRCLIAFLSEAEHGYIICARDPQLWRKVIGAYIDANPSLGIDKDSILAAFTSHVWEFKGQNALLNVKNLVPPLDSRVADLQQVFARQ
ncbi:hypothetical protein FQK23_03850 [Corynebacterium aurimucosum]|uniref:Uncharacterized protein n=1 Tax=Corynebacterium aurimucosum TaxID=169292 RepID=A0A558GJW7_9CORY|nr:hypothetical protein [Corynebacterium sp. HMSC062A03]OFL20070.1 hypothetical protein HMPREF2781_05255 [Corynebacterium sp. HMSC062A03]TVU57176.1 hypothetical protein FQK23_03850 [Corynebacterium aurimucosum]